MKKSVHANWCGLYKNGEIVKPSRENQKYVNAGCHIVTEAKSKISKSLAPR